MLSHTYNPNRKINPLKRSLINRLLYWCNFLKNVTCEFTRREFKVYSVLCTAKNIQWATEGSLLSKRCHSALEIRMWYWHTHLLAHVQANKFKEVVSWAQKRYIYLRQSRMYTLTYSANRQVPALLSKPVFQELVKSSGKYVPLEIPVG